MSPSHFHVVPLTADWERYHSIAGEALLNSDPEQWRRYVERVGKENVRGVYRGEALLGGMAFYQMGQWQSISNPLRWLNRIIRFADAWEARGFPERVEANLHFDVIDDLLPENAGRWRVEIGEGRARVTQGGTGALRLGIGPSVTLLTGFYSASQLRRLGWLEAANEQQVAEADVALCGPSPWMPDVF